MPTDSFPLYSLKPFTKYMVMTLVLWSGVAFGQRYNFQTIEATRDGLPQTQALALHQGSQGYLWIGTYSGIARYSGDSWRVYDKENGLAMNRTEFLTQDSRGRLLVGSVQGGPRILDGDHFRKVHSSKALNSSNVQVIVEDEDQALWFATSSGLFRLKDDELTHLGTEDGLPSLVCRDLVLDRSNVLWVVTEGGLARISGDKAIAFPGNDALEGLDPILVVEDGSGRLFVGCERGLFYKDGSQLKPWLYEGKPLSFYFRCKTVDGLGQVWLGTDRNGVVGLLGDETYFLNTANGLPYHRVTSVLADDQHNLWIGTDMALARYTPGPFSVYDVNHGLSHNFVRCMYLEDNGNVWFGTRAGVSLRTGDGVVKPVSPEFLSQFLVYGIHPKFDGNMLFATLSGVVELRKDGSYKTYGKKDGLIQDQTWSIITDSKNRTWIANGGLSLWTEDGFRNTGSDHPLYATRTMDMLEDRNGLIWLGCDLGLLIYNPETDEVRTVPEVQGITVWDLDMDDNGHIWVGSNGDGLFRFAGDEVKQWKAPDLIPNDFVWQVKSASNGDVWVGHNQGMTRIRDHESVTYTKNDGLAENEACATAILEDGKGHLWFGTAQGVTWYKPEKIPPPSSPSRVHIEAFIVDSRSVPIKGDLRLAPGENNIRIQYAGIDFDGNLRYRFRLSNGGEASWSSINQDTSVIFQGMSPGGYTFEVTALNEDGLWSEEPAGLSFIIEPAVWETLWFRVIASLMLLGLLGLIPRYRIRLLEKKKVDLEALVGERTAELRDANQELQQAQKKLIEAAHGAGMAESAMRLLHNVGNAMNGVNVSISLIEDTFKDSREVQVLQKMLHNLNSPVELEKFLRNEARVDLLRKVLSGVIARFSNREEKVLTEINRLNDRLADIGIILKSQEAYTEMAPYSEPEDLNRLVDHALEIENKLLVSQQIEIQRRYGSLPLVEVSKLKLTRVLINLIQNAADAMGENPKDGRALTLETSVLNGNAVITVRDNGEGVAQEDCARIFFNGYSTRTQPGFGLHFCANAMTEMNGSIEVDSEGSGKGATFSLLLPLAGK